MKEQKMAAPAVLSDHEMVTVTSVDFRRARGCFATGVTVITVEHEGDVHGMTANAFTTVSVDPPLVLVCVNRQNCTHEYLQARQRFGVNILTESQRWISEFYALPTVARCQGSGTSACFSRTKRGTPILDGSLACLECRLQEAYPAGDHTLFVAQVEEIIAGEGQPLLYFRGNYRAIERIGETAKGGRQ
jgi:flavin reductase (DIM6/NTAB) family NADH-FMN oxidoreductase RutF